MTEISIPFGERGLAAALQVPAGAKGVVVFVHGSGVDRHDARDRLVAHKLQHAGFATLQPDLLAPWQAAERHNVFDIDLQGERLLEALRWIDTTPWGKDLPLGLFACGIGAGVALLAAARRPERVRSVVCRGGRPDAALFWLPRVQAPTLLIIDEADRAFVLAYEKLGGPKELVAVPSESHRFNEPAALEAVARHAVDWFARNLGV
jgi:putative phosphoribosyl transferase